MARAFGKLGKLYDGITPYVGEKESLKDGGPGAGEGANALAIVKQMGPAAKISQDEADSSRLKRKS